MLDETNFARLCVGVDAPYPKQVLLHMSQKSL
jgi:hypothetical protein